MPVPVERERVSVGSGDSSCCCLRHSPANRLNVKMGPKVEARLVTSLPHPAHLHVAYTNTLPTVRFQLFSRHHRSIGCRFIEELKLE
jgi:hypothetical protein